MTDLLKPGTKAWHDRQDRHRHNGFIGSAVMMRAQCNSIINSRTATDVSKDIAKQIHAQSLKLEQSLREGRRE